MDNTLLDKRTGLQLLADKAAIGLAGLCTLHCILLPVIITMSPGIASLFLSDEAFHAWLLIAVIPISAYALTLGCRTHGRGRLLIVGVVGICSLLAAIFIAHDYGELWEKTLTVLGSCIIAYAHWQNYRLCKQNNH